MKLLLVLLVFLSITVSGTLACSCSFLEPKDAYCRSNFVGVLRIQGARQNCGNYYCYDMDTSMVIKPGSRASVKVRTPKTTAACGRAFDTGPTFLIAANVNAQGMMDVTSCSWLKSWSCLSSSAQQGYINMFKSTRC